MKGEVMVICERSGKRRVSLAENFLMKEKM